MTAVPQRSEPSTDDSGAIRAALALALDGEFEPADDVAETAYRSAVVLLGRRFERVFDVMRHAGGDRIFVAGGQFDPLQHLMSVAHVNYSRFDALEATALPPAIVFVGCLASADRFAFARIPTLLDAGTIFVTSDKCATLPGIEATLRPGAPQPPRRTRLLLNDKRVASRFDEGMIDPLAGLLPSIRLAPGHLPVAPTFERDLDAWVLASDAATQAPLVVSIAAGRGHVVHAVPHWWQDSDVFDTAVERRSINEMPGLRSAVAGQSETTFGQFSGAWGMLVALVAGLELAFERSQRDDIRSGWRR